MAWLLLAAWVWPLLLALTLLPPAGRERGATRRRAASLPVLGALPGLAAALLLPDGTVLELPWLFLGTTLGLDPTTRVFLLFSGLIWLAAGIDAAVRLRSPADARRFHGLFLLAMAGNLWLITGQDLVSFYVGFAIMGLSAYGLVVHEGSPAARRAGRVYLTLTLIGEVSLFAALVMIVQSAGTTLPAPADLAAMPDAAVALVLLGFGIKGGLVPLHLWLPLAYAAAPTPASAALSGAMSKTALLGWLRFLPVGAAAMPDWGALLAAAGVLALFYALPAGLVQADPKVLLGYSSISKMGLVALVLGCVLMEPALAPAAIPALVLFAAHHGLVKAALFLGLDQPARANLRPLALAGLAFLALALAGAPLTSGALAKYELKPVIAGAPWPWVGAGLAVSTVGVTLLMGRLLWIAMRRVPQQPMPGPWPGLAWMLMLGLIAAFPFALGPASAWGTNLVPVAIGAAGVAAVWLAARANPDWLRPVIGLIPPGDLIVLARPVGQLLGAAGGWLLRPLQVLAAAIADRASSGFEALLARTGARTEDRLRDWRVAGAFWILITMVLLGIALTAWPTSPPAGPAASEYRPAAPAVARPPGRSPV
jgi:formate hydrogenlyase subunit 3/multisubunit Na+/H+ antiporter MnhD subunit